MRSVRMFFASFRCSIDREKQVLEVNRVVDTHTTVTVSGWWKLSCLFEVGAQKSSRTTTRSSRALSPSAFTTVAADDFFPNGGFVSTMNAPEHLPPVTEG